MAEQSQVGPDFVVAGRLGVVKIVEEIDFSIYCFGCYNLGVLRHISRLVNFSLVVDLNVDRDPRLLGTSDASSPDGVGIVIEGIFSEVSGVF
jgi:hypothetical protein